MLCVVQALVLVLTSLLADQGKEGILEHGFFFPS
jgi:hypothetical protein